jgi:hypothetical protein
MRYLETRLLIVLITFPPRHRWNSLQLSEGWRAGIAAISIEPIFDDQGGGVLELAHQIKPPLQRFR